MEQFQKQMITRKFYLQQMGALSLKADRAAIGFWRKMVMILLIWRRLLVMILCPRLDPSHQLVSPQQVTRILPLLSVILLMIL